MALEYTKEVPATGSGGRAGTQHAVNKIFSSRGIRTTIAEDKATAMDFAAKYAVLPDRLINWSAYRDVKSAHKLSAKGIQANSGRE